MADFRRSDGSPTPFTEDIRAHVEHLMSHFHVPSISIGVIDGEDTYLKSFGEAQLSGVKATEETLYYIASVTKSFTATTLLSLLEELADGPDAINLKTKIASIIPADFVLQDEYATSHATLEDALAHTLGVGSHNLSYGGAGYTLRDAVRSLRHLAMTAELREKHQYLNLGYMVIQHVIETLTGNPIEESLHKYIWDPLGMSSTYIRLSEAQNAENVLARGYTYDSLSQTLVDADYTDHYPLVGGGGIISSIQDMTKYLYAVIHKLLPLQPEQQEKLFQPRSIVDVAPNEHESTALYALGWNMSSYRGRRLISHAGGTSGFASKLVFLPDQKWGIAILANADLNGNFANEAVILRLMDEFLGIPVDSQQDIVPRFDKHLKHRVDAFFNARNTLYPNIPKPPLPLALPLSDYAGSYYNPGYQTFELLVSAPREGTPVADRRSQVLHVDIRRFMNMTLDLEHVSGDFFIAWTDTRIPSISVKGGMRAQFTLGPNGKVDKCGIKFHPEDDRMMVWFTKVA